MPACLMVPHQENKVETQNLAVRDRSALVGHIQYTSKHFDL